MIKTTSIQSFYHLFFLLLLAMSGVLLACSSDELKPIDNTKTGITLRFRTAISQTRADVNFGEEEGNENENAINKVDIFFYDGETLVWHPSSSKIQLSESNTYAKIIVDKTDEIKFTGNINYTLYVVINFPDNLSSENNITLSDLKKKVLSATFNTATPITDFVMTGGSSHTINLTNIPIYDAGTIDLKRVAVKIRPQHPVIPAEIEEYTPGGTKKYRLNATAEQPIQVRLVNYQNKSYLDEPRNYYSQPGAAAQNTQYKDIIRTVNPEGSISTIIPIFYSYENQWESEDSPNRTFLEYRVPLLDVAANTTRYYYYSVGIAGKKSGNAAGFNKAERNHLYQVTPHIGRIGGTTQEELIEVNGHYRIADWTTNSLNVEIVDAHYFVVKEYNVILANTNTYSVPFEATRSVSVKSIGEVYFTQYNPTNGSSSKITIPPGDSRYPSFSIVNTAPKRIIVTSAIPENYAPRYFSATFTDTGGLEETVNFVQYPEKYVTGRISDAADLIPGVDYGTDPNQNNYNLFTVTTLTGSGLKIGDPSYRAEDGKIYTKTDAESNQLVSPKFVIASQRGIYGRVFMEHSFMSFQGQGIPNKKVLSARERCANYGEGGYPVGTWRLPTRAEIKYIDMLQDEGVANPEQSSVRKLLEGDAYWSAQPYKYYNFTTTTNPENVTNEAGWNTGGENSSDWNYYFYYFSANDPGYSYTGYYNPQNGVIFPWLIERRYGNEGWGFYETRYISAYVRCVHDVY